LLVAPQAMRSTFVDHIEQEIEHARAGRQGRIVAKMNELGDSRIISKLYEASQAGVEIDLIVRGICRLRPGLDGISESIRVVSIVGRFLEHDRVFYFANAGDPHLYIGSADWQRSRLDDRVEAAVPILDAHHQDRILRSLQAALDDPRTAWELRPDGRYVQRTPADASALGVQEQHMEEASERAGVSRNGYPVRR
jgi:polyphosphate kinase